VTTGLITHALEQELLDELRRRGIVVWFDATSYFTPFVDDLAARHKAGTFRHPVVAFRGSFLALLLALNKHGDGLDPAPLLIHMPGYNEDTIRATPVLELYEAGSRFRKAPETLIREIARGRVAPEALEALLAKGLPSLEEADRWLDSQLTTTREGFAGQLEQLGIGVVLGGVLDVLARRQSFLDQQVASEATFQVFEAFLERHTGMNPSWLAFCHVAPASKPAERLYDVAAAFVGWLLCVEYANDLARAPYLRDLQPLRELSPPLIKTSTALVTALREKHAESYASLADEMELRIVDELKKMRPEDLGRIDTFRAEEQAVLDAAVEALRAGDYAKAYAFAEARTEETSFWLKRDQARRREWTLVREAAGLGVTLARLPRPLERSATLDAAVSAYTEHAFEVDRAHRRFEQRQATLLDSELPYFAKLKDIVRLLRRAYRVWADQLARDFTTLCREHGFLPEPALQQRTLFDEVVAPLAADERVAFFLLDAFRYEMATELVDELKTSGSAVTLKARLAELPTITPVGMNVLAPVATSGRLQMAGTFGGFRTGEYTVRTPGDRARAIGQRGGGKGSVLLPLADVCELAPEPLKRKIRDARIVVVHGTEIDDAGEANVGPATFEVTLRGLRSAYAALQKAGVKSFVFTADHGFLLLDDASLDTVPFGTRRDPHRRYVLDTHPRAETGMVNVSLAALGYEGLEGHLLFREDTAVFATGNSGATFVHGGNSLQERLIPVLTVQRSRAQGKAHNEYVVEAEKLKDVVGLRHLKVRLMDKEQLSFVAAKEVSLAIRAVGRTGPSEVRTVLKEITGPGAVRDGTLRLPVGKDWSEVFFTLESSSPEPVRVELFHPEGLEQVQPCTLAEWFEVDWKKAAPKSEPATTTPPPDTRALDWADALPEGPRKVFQHLHAHGSITEAEVVRVLGSPREFRRFSLAFEEHAAKVPFRVRIEAAAEGKRYVKEGER